MDKAEMTYCRGCKAEEEMHRPIDEHFWARRDAYGIFTGIYCDDCYNSDDVISILIVKTAMLRT